MKWKTKRRQKGSWRHLTTLRPLFPGIVSMKRSLFVLLLRNSTGLTGRRQENLHESKMHTLWLIVEYQYVLESPKVGVCLYRMWKKKWPVVRRSSKKIMLYLLRLFGSAGLTFVYSRWVIEQAFFERGYRAYGGEYFLIPLVFYGIYQVWGYIEKCQKGV